MKPNIGITDRVIRVFIAMIIAVFLVMGNINDTVGIVLAVAAVVLLTTGFTGYCPIYKLIKVNTKNKVKQNKQTL
jgi:quinol-cytochrome oxidoreductase complex cytochrome b subunit